jgi:hypothetical protein
VTDPNNPQLAGQLAIPPDVTDVAFADRHAYAITDSGLSVIDVADPAQPAMEATVPVGERPVYVTVAGDRAYVAESRGRLHVLDVGDPASPEPLGALERLPDMPGFDHIEDLAVRDGLVFLVHRMGVRLIDVSQPSLPREVDWLGMEELGTNVGVVDIAIQGDLAFLAAQEDGLFVARLLLRPERAVYLPLVSRTP